jgi:exopolysaccharide biosynthesis polyprenyl glycosylphosphotransferase
MQTPELAFDPPAQADDGGFVPAPHPPKRWADQFASDLLILVSAAGDWMVAFTAIWLGSRTDLTGCAQAIGLFHRGDGYPIFGALTFVSILSGCGVYGRRRLMHLQKIISRLGRGGMAWSFFYLGFVAVIASVSTASLTFAFATIGYGAAGVIIWRLLFHRFVSDESIARHLRQRILLIGWTPEAGRLSQAVWQSRSEPCEIIGYVEHSSTAVDCAAPANIPFLGNVDDLPRILEENNINVAWLTDVNVDGDRIPQFAAQCEKEMVEFKIIPTYFPILISALHVEMVSGTPILGVDRLPLNSLHLRVLKRLVDIVGSLIGLILSAPVIAFFCAVVYSESPGPVFYKQTRMGRKGKPFEIFKIRSMRLDAEKSGSPGWTTKDDPRRLRIGSLMRRLNIDELPQFWNVLKGEMSLVGPRPERPELILNFKHEIEHYNARHTIKPGLTGWAQCNGLRGDTDLSERIRYDIYYMEHWNLFFDLRIMFLTLINRKNAC